MAQAAEILGKLDESLKYTRLSEEIRQAVLDEYFSSTGRLCIDTQAAYIISLRFRIYRKKKRVIEGLKERLRKDCYRIKCGFVGAPVMCQVLSENGMEDLAYRILFYEGFPGWLHCVRLGATTIWERWNSVLDNGKISGTNMNSLNHYAYGSVVEFLYRELAGIKPLSAGFQRVLIEPKFTSHIQSCHCSYDSISGRYTVDWQILESGAIKIKVEVPFNCIAKLKLADAVQEVEREIELEAGITELEYQSQRDYMRPFNENSILSELAENTEAMALLQEYLPVAVGMIAGADGESMSLSLHDMLAMPYMGFAYENVMQVIEKIKEIKLQKKGNDVCV